MDKKISFPIAIIIIVVLAVLTGGIVIWQYFSIPEIEISQLTPSEKPPADWKSCSIDSDCICCDKVLKKETDITLEKEACINIDYYLYDTVECLQIEHPNAFCAKNICKCEDNKCITTPKDETADWQTYKNDEYGFEVKYPKDFKCENYSYKESEIDLLIFRMSCQGFFIKDPPYKGERFMLSGVDVVDVYVNKEMLSLFDWIVKNKLKNIPITFEYTSLTEGEISITPSMGQTITMSKIITSNYQGIRVKDAIEGGISDGVYFIKNDRIYKIGYMRIVPISEEGFNQILSTFRFLDWQFFSIKEYGFSMEIHPDYIKTREEEIERKALKMKLIVFSKDSEKITITIEKEPDFAKIMRSALFGAIKLGPKEWQREQEYYSEIGLVEPGNEFISKENVERGTCIGIQLLEKKGTKYEQNLLLTSPNLEDMFVTILFEYYTKNTEAEILKMIETIDCTK